MRVGGSIAEIPITWREVAIGVRKADVLVSLTQGDAIDWIQKNNNTRVVVIPNVVNLNRTGQFSAYTQKRVIYAGRFAYLKGIPNMIKIGF